MSPTSICLRVVRCFSKCFSCEHVDSIWASISLGVKSLVFTYPSFHLCWGQWCNLPGAFCNIGSNFSCPPYYKGGKRSILQGGSSETWDVIYSHHSLSQVYGLMKLSIKIFYTFGLLLNDRY